MSTPRTGRKISQLPVLETASLDVYVVGYSGDTTYRLTLDSLGDVVLDTISSSLDSRIDFLEAFSASYNEFSTSVDSQLNDNSASALEGRLDILESFTGSYATTGSNSFTGSQSIEGAITASYFKGDGSALTNITGALSLAILDEGIYKGHATTLNFTGSNVTTTIVGGLALVQILGDSTNLSTASFSSFTSSYYVDSASFDARILAATNEGQFATTGSNQFYGNQNVSGSIILEGGKIVSNLYASTSIDIIPNQNEGYVELGSYNSQSFLWVDNTGVHIATEYDTHGHVWHFNNNGGVTVPGNITGAPNLITKTQTGSFAITGSNHFIGNQYFTGSLIPEGSGSHSLGSLQNPWQDLYITSASVKLVKDGQVITILSANENGDLIISSSQGDLNLNYYIDTASFAKVDLVNTLIQATSSYETTGRNILSGSIESLLPNGVISSSVQITITESQISDLTHTDISALNQFTQSYNTDSASFDNRITSLTVAGTPPGTISGSEQITAFGFVSGSYETTGRGILSGSVSYNDLTNIPIGLISSSAQFNEFETTGRSIISSSQQIADLGFAKSGGDAIFNNVTANQYIVSSSVYYVTASYSSGSTISGNSLDDTHQFTGSVLISGSLTANLTNGHMWVGNSLNKSYEIPTSSFATSASFNSFTSSYLIDSASAAANRTATSASLATFQASLGVTSTPFNYSSVLNPTNYVLVSYPTASFNGGSMDIIVTRASDSTAVSVNCLLASFGGTGTIAANGSRNSGAGAPNPSFDLALSGSHMNIRISVSAGTYTIKGVARLF